MLALPISRTGAPAWSDATAVTAGWHFAGGAPLSVAFFTAVSATTVTGLIVVDTATYWSHFGQGVLCILFEFGGIGTMTIAALLAIMVAKRLNLRQRIDVATTTGVISTAEIRHVARRIVNYSLLCQLVFAVPIVAALMYHGEPPKRALKNGVFIAISAFNNAGFAPYTDNLTAHAILPLITVPVCLLIVIGGIGFPVILELRKAFFSSLRQRHPHIPFRYRLNTKLMIFGSIALIIVGWVLTALSEWNNPKTIGHYTVAQKLLTTLFASITPRTAGFNAMDVAGQSDVTWLITDVLMFIGGGPAGTAGGIKVTTFLIIFFIIVTEVRMGRAVQMFDSRIGRSTQRQAITVFGLQTTFIVLATGAMLALTPYGLDRVLFEVVSAVNTVGLSTGITQFLPISAQMVICVLMFFGRLGPVTIASIIAVKPAPRLYEAPKERPLIG